MQHFSPEVPTHERQHAALPRGPQSFVTLGRHQADVSRDARATACSFFILVCMWILTLSVCPHSRAGYALCYSDGNTATALAPYSALCRNGSLIHTAYRSRTALTRCSVQQGCRRATSGRVIPPAAWHRAPSRCNHAAADAPAMYIKLLIIFS